jgi:shikimate dehydrogenase
MELRLGLVGERIAYSLSPRIIEWGLAQTKMPGRYTLRDLAADDARLWIRGGNWDGLNVTMPHKSLAAECCDDLTETAQRSGAVNTLWHRDERITGDNTDAAGFRYALGRIVPPEDPVENILIIGGGGAARAVFVALTDLFPQAKITMALRDETTMHGCVRQWAAQLLITICTLTEAAESISIFDLVIQATPVGSAHLPGLPLVFPPQLKRDVLMMDLIYAPQETAFLRRARAWGARTANGLPMLIAQAAESFQLWTGEQFPLERAMEELLPELTRL